ncbi:hypothetical protein [Methylobacterium aquaticum]|uniref:Uncharacterized protein n=1 Tax=Methylobacterium aquaticum TaxID=270351 RepID=A0A0C6F9J6_9HYPH|nr:hypothetical protein [Methylobacterium aquaticum]BAQ49471.1 hypothetical protein Maq22A_1p36315 [Methylobacterium aquaticum]
MVHPDSIRAFGRFKAARAAGASTSTPPVEWFAGRLKRRAAERAVRLAEARAARGPVSSAAIDTACEAVCAAAGRAVGEACAGGERADIERWNATAKRGRQ